MNNKPLRQEDYQAMAVECARLTAENVQLRKQERSNIAATILALMLGGMMLTVLVTVLVYITGSIFQSLAIEAAHRDLGTVGAVYYRDGDKSVARGKGQSPSSPRNLAEEKAAWFECETLPWIAT